MLIHFSHVRFYVTVWTVACQTPLSMRILQAKILEWVAMLKKEFIGPGLHLRPVHADHARPPLQWTLNSVLSACGNDNGRIRPPLDRGILKITSRLLIA